MDPELKSLLQHIEQGDNDDLPKLAEMLESRGDDRASLARQAMHLNPQEIADELVKIRSVRPAHDFLISVLAELGLGGTALSVGLSTHHLESAPTTPRWWRPSEKRCLRDVEKALETKVLSVDISRAMSNARRLRIDRLLAAFNLQINTTPLSPPELN